MQWPPGAAPSSEQVRRWQLARLREVVAHARHASPFYAAHLAGVDAPAIRTATDFSRLPLLTAEAVRNAPEQLLCVSRDEIARVVTLHSSGTTGPPKRIFHTPDDMEATVDYFRWGMAAMIGHGQTALVLMPGQRPGGVGQLLVQALARAGARAVPHGELTRAGDALDQMIGEKADCLVGPAAHVNMVAREWEARGLPRGRIRSVLLCWDTAPDAVVRNVGRIFGCQVFRHWGMIETGLGGAVECAPGSGMHLRETDVYLEIVDPATAAPLPDGEFGEMVVTTPLRRGMPLIRYRTGDMGRILPSACPCGSPLRLLDPFIRRMGDGARVGTGTLTLAELGEALYALPGLRDFAAWHGPRTLKIRACGDAKTLEQSVRSALRSIPVIEQAVAADRLDIVIETTSDDAPAVPGLGKRRLQPLGSTTE
jgi:phenylacetate-coenzyme A ligase PaaK-like adenylate-forming protein